MEPTQIVGWDIGGAHLKAAVLSPSGRLQKVVQLPCEVWRGLERLDRAVDRVADEIGADVFHALTMTAELVDLFPDRAAGVTAIVSRFRERFSRPRISVYAGRRGFVGTGRVDACVDQIASANWLASAQWTGSRIREGLFVDIGSTTTDLIPVKGGRVATECETDAQRLTRDELIYTGVVRTPVCALVDRVPFRGEWQTVAAELFATAADCYRLLNRLTVDSDQQETADGKDKTVESSARRLGRMLGRDSDPDELHHWRAVARHIARRQTQRILDAADRVLSGADLAADSPLVGAGVGRFLASGMAEQLGRPYRDASELLDLPGGLAARASDCLPAVAVALLAHGCCGKTLSAEVASCG